MTDLPATIADLFEAAPSGEAVARAFSSDERTELDAQIRVTPGFHWDTFEKDVAGAYRDMLDVKIIDVFCGAWVKLNELQEYRDRTKHPPDELSRVPLKKHTIRSTHKPSIEILVGERTVSKLEFDVVLELALEAFVLGIRDGRIRDISSGEFRGTGKLQCRGFELARVASKKYRLPGTLAIEGGVPIPAI